MAPPSQRLCFHNHILLHLQPAPEIVSHLCMFSSGEKTGLPVSGCRSIRQYRRRTVYRERTPLEYKQEAVQRHCGCDVPLQSHVHYRGSHHLQTMCSKRGGGYGLCSPKKFFFSAWREDDNPTYAPPPETKEREPQCRANRKSASYRLVHRTTLSHHAVIVILIVLVVMDRTRPPPPFAPRGYLLLQFSSNAITNQTELMNSSNSLHNKLAITKRLFCKWVCFDADKCPCLEPTYTGDSSARVLVSVLIPAGSGLLGYIPTLGTALPGNSSVYSSSPPGYQ